MRLSLGYSRRITEIYQFYLTALPDHHIISLDVPMGDPIGMQIGDGLSELQGDLIA